MATASLPSKEICTRRTANGSIGVLGKSAVEKVGDGRCHGKPGAAVNLRKIRRSCLLTRSRDHGPGRTLQNRPATSRAQDAGLEPSFDFVHGLAQQVRRAPGFVALDLVARPLERLREALAVEQPEQVVERAYLLIFRTALSLFMTLS